MTSIPPIAGQKPHSFTHHGVTVSDPWHWLKDPGYPNVTDKEILAYLEAENAYFEEQMAEHSSLRDRIFEEIKGRIKEDDSAVPWKEGEFMYRWRFDKGGEYRIWSRRPVAGGDESVILDEPSDAGDAEYYRMVALDVSRDGRLMAWSVDKSGAERFTIRVRDLESGEVLPDVLEETSGGVVWNVAGTGSSIRSSTRSGVPIA
ncbi:MAG: hypothetical protein U5O39_03610 [Gammaproteobacteria bacterium]|nr:hypothetical protein [Gammaproteobacteria bacterium]